MFLNKTRNLTSKQENISILYSTMIKVNSKVAPMHASKTCEGLEVELHAIFNSILNAGEWKLHVSVAFTPGEIPRRYPLSRKQGGTYIS